MILHLPHRPVNDNNPDELAMCPLCESVAFILQYRPDDTIIIKCGECFADCTKAVVRQLSVPIDLSGGGDHAA